MSICSRPPCLLPFIFPFAHTSNGKMNPDGGKQHPNTAKPHDRDTIFNLIFECTFLHVRINSVSFRIKDWPRRNPSKSCLRISRSSIRLSSQTCRSLGAFFRSSPCINISSDFRSFGTFFINNSALKVRSRAQTGEMIVLRISRPFGGLSFFSSRVLQFTSRDEVLDRISSGLHYLRRDSDVSFAHAGTAEVKVPGRFYLHSCIPICLRYDANTCIFL